MTFFDQYSFEKKNRALLVIIALIILVVYKKPISETLELVKIKNETRVKLLDIKNNDKRLRNLQNQLFQINQYLGIESSEKNIQQQFLNFFYQNQTSLKIESITEPIIFNHPDFKINTYEINISGDFISSLQFVYFLETKFKLARVISISFEVKKEMNSQSDFLNTKLYIQNYSR